MRRWVDAWIFGAESFGAELTLALSCNGAQLTWRSVEAALSWDGAELLAPSWAALTWQGTEIIHPSENTRLPF